MRKNKILVNGFDANITSQAHFINATGGAKMNDLSISQMQLLQLELWEKYRNAWSPLEPKYARDSLLWMIEEIGEVIAIIKKRGDDSIVKDNNIHKIFVEEMCDVLMFFNDVLLRYGITGEEFTKTYIEKHNKNMKRDFIAEDNNYLRE